MSEISLQLALAVGNDCDTAFCWSETVSIVAATNEFYTGLPDALKLEMPTTLCPLYKPDKANMCNSGIFSVNVHFKPHIDLLALDLSLKWLFFRILS